MGIHHESNISPEAHVLNFKMDSKKYILVKNHVREVMVPIQVIDSKNDEQGKAPDSCGKKSKKRKKSMEEVFVPGNHISDGEVDEITASDLEELKTVYKKCKSILLKIETKYGHLLGLNSKESCPSKIECNDIKNECRCTFNSKIVFNEEGHSTQLTGNSYHHHICHNKLQKDKYIHSEQIQIENENEHTSLPDSIQELGDMLTNVSIPINLRNKVIEKIKCLRQENLNMIRFDKGLLIQKLKSDPDEILDFKGTNISSLAGYPT